MSDAINNIRWEDGNRVLIVTRYVEEGILESTLSWAEPVNDPEERKKKEAISIAYLDKNEMHAGERKYVRHKGPLTIITIQGPPTWWWPRIFYTKTDKLVFGWGKIGWVISRRKAKTPPTKEADGA
jgi:hypothetical protein